MDRHEILDAANAKEWFVYDKHDKKVGRGKLAGARLDFPVVHLENGLSTEISWALAERLATGESKRVLL